MNPVFKNRHNLSHNVGDRLVWESRSAAVNGVVAVFLHNHEYPFILVSERGPKAADYQGLMNVVAGYLDWDESGTEAIYREIWEETGLDLERFAYMNKQTIIFKDNLMNPWHVNTNPSENRQNISLRYGIVLERTDDLLPELSLKHNEVVGEVSKAFWMPLNEIDNYKWAFNHDQVIKDYIKLANSNK